MIRLRYNVENDSPLAKLASKAARAWMDELNPDLRGLRVDAARIWIHSVPLIFANVIIRFGEVDRRSAPTRVAQCQTRGSMHIITLASDITWRITWWQRFMGIGQEDAYAALLHEFGHASLRPRERCHGTRSRQHRHQ